MEHQSEPRVSGTSTLPPAGWYPDPHNPETTQRWWNGKEWADAHAPIDTPVVDPQDPPRPLSRLQAVAVAGLIVVAFLEAFNIYADGVYLGVIEDLLDQEDVATTRIDDAEQVVDIAAIALAAGSLVIGPLAFLPWFYRGYLNLRRLGLRNLRYSPGWAIGSWFIPIFNLFRPKQIANDLQRATHGGTLHTTGRINDQPVAPLLHWWWAMYLLGNFIAISAFSGVDEEEEILTQSQALDTLEEEQAIYGADIAASLVSIVAVVLAVLVIKRITREQETVIASPSATLHQYVTPPST
jgi:hypothetical protein